MKRSTKRAGKIKMAIAELKTWRRIAALQRIPSLLDH
jgi:hypothetical protein